MQLHEAGELSIEDYLGDYVEHPNGDTIKIKHLLQHSSRIRAEPWSPALSYWAGISNLFDWPLPSDWLVAEYLSHATPNDFGPGVVFEYASPNYGILAKVVEKVSHRNFHDYVQEHIFEPADMTMTSYTMPKWPYCSRTIDYHPVGALFQANQVLNAPYAHTSLAFGSGDAVSTPIDLAKFAGALVQGQLLGDEALNIMLGPPTLPDFSGNQTNYRYGIRVYNRGTPEEVWSHNGYFWGFKSLFYVAPNVPLVAVLTSNINRVNAAGTGQFNSYEQVLQELMQTAAEYY
jgi:CubicO group peptidase (beta-lactamase class C family)